MSVHRPQPEEAIDYEAHALSFAETSALGGGGRGHLDTDGLVWSAFSDHG